MVISSVIRPSDWDDADWKGIFLNLVHQVDHETGEAEVVEARIMRVNAGGYQLAVTHLPEKV